MKIFHFSGPTPRRLLLFSTFDMFARTAFQHVYSSLIGSLQQRWGPWKAGSCTINHYRRRCQRRHHRGRKSIGRGYAPNATASWAHWTLVKVNTTSSSNNWVGIADKHQHAVHMQRGSQGVAWADQKKDRLHFPHALIQSTWSAPEVRSAWSIFRFSEISWNTLRSAMTSSSTEPMLVTSWTDRTKIHVEEGFHTLSKALAHTCTRNMRTGTQACIPAAHSYCSYMSKCFQHCRSLLLSSATILRRSTCSKSTVSSNIGEGKEERSASLCCVAWLSL